MKKNIESLDSISNDENSREIDKIIPEIKKDRELNPGDMVVVRRSSGKLEDGWVVEAYDPIKDKFLVSGSNGRLRKLLAGSDIAEAERDFKEIKDDLIINHNLEQMKTSMLELLMNESIGGNAGTVKVGNKTEPCYGANGYADIESGKILTFANYSKEAEGRKNYAPFIFRLNAMSNFIIEFYCSESFSSHSKNVIKESVARWNKTINNNQ